MRRRLFPLLAWLTAGLFGILVLGPLGNLVYDLIYKQSAPVLRALAQAWPALLPIALLLGSLTLWAYREAVNGRRRDEFALCKSTAKLRPEDLRFQLLEPGERPYPDPQTRPLFAASYVPRRAVPYDRLAEPNPGPVYTEADFANALQKPGRQRTGLVLLGQPLDGKTLALYEILRRMEGYEVVIPLKDRPVPSDDAFAYFKGRRAALLLDDLNDYASYTVDVPEFYQRLGRRAVACAVVATCRNGPELEVVRTGLGRFYEDIPLKFSLLPLVTLEKERLAQAIGKGWQTGAGDLFPTPGSITMAEPIAAMRERFERLPGELQDTLRSLKLLAVAGVLPFTHRRLRAVLEQHFERHLPNLGDCLNVVATQAFLRRPAWQDPVQPEPAYLRDAVVYIEGMGLPRLRGQLAARLPAVATTTLPPPR